MSCLSERVRRFNPGVNWVQGRGWAWLDWPEGVTLPGLAAKTAGRFAPCMKAERMINKSTAGRTVRTTFIETHSFLFRPETRMLHREKRLVVMRVSAQQMFTLNRV